MSTSDRLTEIVRERYQTGAYGNAFLIMSKATMDTIPGSGQPKAYETHHGGLMRLWDIPIVLDAALPAGAWRLLDRTTGAEIESDGVPKTWTQAIEALRGVASTMRLAGDARTHMFAGAADYLTDRAAALTEEGGQ